MMRHTSNKPSNYATTGKSFPERHVPTVADYRRAFMSLPQLPPSYIGMMGFHLHQPQKTVTATSMAKAVGFKNHNAAGLHYGRLAGLVGERVGWRPQERGKVKLTVLAKFDKRAGKWHWIMRNEVAEALKGWLPSFELMPGEMPEKTELREGKVHKVAVNPYERNEEARRKCLAHYGPSCQVCGFNFKAAYGLEEEFIHVHHIRSLAEIGKEYEVDPVRDLVPVCANCHSAIHLKNPPYRPDELKAILVGRLKAPDEGSA